MKDMVLPTLLESGLSWTEEIPEGARQNSSMSFGADFGQAVLNIKIDGSLANVQRAIAYIVGYSQCLGRNPIAGGPEVPFDPNNRFRQGPFRLSRKIPARHPAMPNLFATKILSVQGRGLRNAAGDDGSVQALPTDPVARAEGGGGTYGQYKYVYISIQFEIPRYPIMDDAELNGRPEYVRYHEWIPDTNSEILGRKGIIWTFCQQPNSPLVGPPTPPLTFPGDRTVRQPKTKLTIKGYDIHQDYVMLGRILPSNYHMQVGTVNSRDFPHVAYRDQNAFGVGTVVQFRPGTCLLLAPKMTPHAQCHPAVLAGEISPDYFPRTLDVETNILIFDPPMCEAKRSLINLSVNGIGDAATGIYGHQLAPLVRPKREANGRFYTWYAAKNTPNVGLPSANGSYDPVTDQELLYRYSNFEDLWKAAESLTLPVDQ